VCSVGSSPTREKTFGDGKAGNWSQDAYGVSQAGFIESWKAMNLMSNHEKLSELSSRKRRGLTGSLLLFLGAILGSASAFFGLCVTFAADEYDQFRGAALVIAIFMGALVPIDIYLILSFLSGPT
jgi:hypothetical protein